jgi:hypothetical protein
MTALVKGKKFVLMPDMDTLVPEKLKEAENYAEALLSLHHILPVSSVDGILYSIIHIF